MSSPDWLNKRGYSSVGLREYSDHADTATLIQPGGVSRKRAGQCHDCNTGWMSRLEFAAEPILVTLFEATAQAALLATEQAVLARWAFKTAVILSYARGN